ncbi:MAG: excinuclease ABC subunit UvrA [Ureaplasma sp.]|nr:excinuclease ABC subunit UvrA [Ureaplasma sp.]MDE7221794.1 excinuclease ABC subunit UvrA [Ureaplasma sp.]
MNKCNDSIIVHGARENNLKNIDITIPKNKFVVITGLSGSGKSSLAFDTIYAEGQRRYLESLSTYTRQFLGGNEKPDVDSIEGLSPSIAIDQKSTSNNPRSTVGTVTEIYDYLRVFFARIGTPYCINGHGIIKTQTIKQIVDYLFDLSEETKIILYSPMISNEKGTHESLLNNLRNSGFLRVRIDNEVYSLDDNINLDKNKRHTIEVMVDRIILRKDSQTRSRLNDSVETALKTSNGFVLAQYNNEEKLFNEHYACDKCGFSIPNLEPRLFSFNSPLGACDNCKGIGVVYEPDPNKMIPNKDLSIIDGAIDFFKNTVNTTNMDWQRYFNMLMHYQIPIDKPISELSEKEIHYILYGSDEPITIIMESANGRKYEQLDYVEGPLDLIKRRYQETSSDMAREYYSKYMTEKTCPKCKGQRLNDLALCVKINNKSIIDLTKLDIQSAIDFLLSLNLTKDQQIISKLVLKEIIDRLSFLNNVGLDYLMLSRNASTLSGGEAQRIRLATQIGSHLTGVLYVLDEPSIGLHQKDNEKLIKTIRQICNLGNSMLVVEHDEDTMNSADWLIDIGPGAGTEGGYVVSQGEVDEVKNDSNSLTGQYLSGKKFIPIPTKRRSGNGKKIILKNATGNNLKNINLEIPLGKMIAVTGVSGSGKSTLILDTLVKGLNKQLFNPFEDHAPFKEIIGANNIDKIIEVSQDPIGRTPRSNPATYTGVFDDIRDVFSNIVDAKEKGYSKGRFSFNVKGGRCEHCQGDGVIKIDMQFLPSVYITCEECQGKRYNEETLKIKFKGKSIYDVLKMTIAEAAEFFTNIPMIHRKLQLLVDVGLGYLQLGASSNVLSGGEAQRIKLAKFLQRKATGKTLFVLDEPTTGLHIHDISKLIDVLNKIVDNGDTAIIIEHNLDLIKVCDHIIDLGPDGGIRGGEILVTGTPEQIVSSNKFSYTADYLKKLFQRGY